MLKRCFYRLKQRNVPMFHVTKKDLRDFTTTEKDMKKGLSKFPTPDYQVKEGEDLFAAAGGSAAATQETPMTDEGVFANANSGAEDFQAQ